MISKIRMNSHRYYFLIILLVGVVFLGCKKSMDEILYDREKEGCFILNVNDNGFYYLNNNILYYYDDISQRDLTIFEKGNTEIRLYNIELEITDEANIIVHYDYSSNVYDEYYEYDNFTDMLKTKIKNGFIPSLLQKGVDKPHFTKDKGIILKIDDYGYLITPNDDRIDCILIEEPEYETSEIDYSKYEILYKNRFNLSELPKKFQPKFDNNLLNYIFYSDHIADEEEEYKDIENKFRWFECKVKLYGDGNAQIMDTISSVEDPLLRFHKNLLQNKSYLKLFLEGDKTCNLRRWYYQDYWFYSTERYHHNKSDN